MSLISFLKKLWAAVASLWGKIPADIKTAVRAGIFLVENIKAFADSPVADILTAIIPGDLDDKLKDLLRHQLPGILVQLQLVDASLHGVADPNEMAAIAIKALSARPDARRYYQDLAVLVAQLLADGKLSWSDGIVVVEWVYQHEVKAA